MARIATLLIALLFAGCGSDRFASERDQVQRLSPGAEGVRCTGEPGRSVDCEAELLGRTLYCEFRFEEHGRDYSGSSSCWVDLRS